MKKRYILIFIFMIPLNIIPQQSSLSRSVNYISDYIASQEFRSYLNNEKHIRLVDSIYLAALKINSRNISETLLSLTFATIPYKKVPITLPLLNVTIFYPLVSAEDSIFIKKNRNLPSKIYFDSPLNDYGDKDKISHFFGNAFLGYNSTFLDVSNLLGLFVEIFEETFKVQSKIDLRDLETNFYGRAFGKALKKNEFFLPSQSLILYPFFYSFYTL